MLLHHRHRGGKKPDPVGYFSIRTMARGLTESGVNKWKQSMELPGPFTLGTPPGVIGGKSPDVLVSFGAGYQFSGPLYIACTESKYAGVCASLATLYLSLFWTHGAANDARNLDTGTAQAVFTMNTNGSLCWCNWFSSV